jgi:hypothetical protein
MEAPNIDYAAVLADLRAKRDKLNAAIEAIEPLVFSARPAPPAEGAGSDTGMGDETSSPRETKEAFPARVEPDTFFGLSITEAARKYLRMKKRPAATREITDALLEGGYLTNSKVFYSNVFASLRRSPEFVSVQQKWGLAEWYPGRRLDQLKRTVKEGAQTKEEEQVVTTLQEEESSSTNVA